jgi:hypothetical protein
MLYFRSNHGRLVQHGLDNLAKNAKDWKCKLLFNQQADIVEAREV